MKLQKKNKFFQVICPKCNSILGLANCENGSKELGWFDPYVKGIQYTKHCKGAYVCYECLSSSRKLELKEQIALNNKG